MNSTHLLLCQAMLRAEYKINKWPSDSYSSDSPTPKLICKFKKNNAPFGISRRTCSFSQDANDALRASVIFLLVPGVKGGTCVGISETEKEINVSKFHI